MENTHTYSYVKAGIKQTSSTKDMLWEHKEEKKFQLRRFEKAFGKWQLKFYDQIARRR